MNIAQIYSVPIQLFQSSKAGRLMLSLVVLWSGKVGDHVVFLSFSTLLMSIYLASKIGQNRTLQPHRSEM